MAEIGLERSPKLLQIAQEVPAAGPLTLQATQCPSTPRTRVTWPAWSPERHCRCRCPTAPSAIDVCCPKGRGTGHFGLGQLLFLRVHCGACLVHRTAIRRYVRRPRPWLGEQRQLDALENTSEPVHCGHARRAHVPGENLLSPGGSGVVVAASPNCFRWFMHRASSRLLFAWTAGNIVPQSECK